MTYISIILPVYNAEKYISKCIDSLIGQTFKDIEIVCVNDGSKDNSLHILEEYAKKDSRIKVVSQQNSGPATARNNGLRNSSGEYIMFCDSDDWYEPNMCEIMYKSIVDNKVDVVCCNANVIDEEDDLLRNDTVDYYYNKYIGHQNITNEIIKNTNCVLWNKIFKRSIIDNFNICFPDKREHDDWCFYAQYMSVVKDIYYLDDKLYNYLRRGSSIMGKMSKKEEKSIFDHLYVSKKYYDFLQENNIFNERKAIFLCLLIYIREYGLGRWNKDELNKAKDIYSELYGPNKLFYSLIFNSEFNIFNFITIIKKFYFEDYLFAKYIIKVGNKKIFSFKRKLKYVI